MEQQPLLTKNPTYKQVTQSQESIGEDYAGNPITPETKKYAMEKRKNIDANTHRSLPNQTRSNRRPASCPPCPPCNIQGGKKKKRTQKKKRRGGGPGKIPDEKTGLLQVQETPIDRETLEDEDFAELNKIKQQLLREETKKIDSEIKQYNKDYKEGNYENYIDIYDHLTKESGTIESEGKKEDNRFFLSGQPQLQQWNQFYFNKGKSDKLVQPTDMQQDILEFMKEQNKGKCPPCQPCNIQGGKKKNRKRTRRNKKKKTVGKMKHKKTMPKIKKKKMTRRRKR
tara:strand:- start:321 stop:1169 length:849 start_codon:yes stop_codon:yes gene_type:complete